MATSNGVAIGTTGRGDGRRPNRIVERHIEWHAPLHHVAPETTSIDSMGRHN